MKTLIVIQARTGSSRLPGKVLLPLAGAPLLVRMVERVKSARTNADVVVATTVDPADVTVATICEDHGIACFRGHPTDLLDRHFRAAEAHGAELVVKIPSDCPLIDPRIIEQVLAAVEDGDDFVSNLHPATFPDGNDVEVMRFAALECAWREATAPHEREHTTPFLWDQPERFRIRNVRWERGEDYSMSHRFTIDYAEDYDFVRAVFDALWPESPMFSLEDILDLLQRRPEIYALNAQHRGVNWYRHHLAELRTVGAAETRLEEAPR